MSERSISGLRLPTDLVRLIEAGEWKAPDDDRLARVFGEPASRATFYSFEDLKFENEAWAQETSPEYLGTRDAKSPPGDLDPMRSILIGDLGHDLPFALDYRDASQDPRVVFFGRRVFGRWITVAKNFTELAQALGIELVTQ